MVLFPPVNQVLELLAFSGGSLRLDAHVFFGFEECVEKFIEPLLGSLIENFFPYIFLAFSHSIAAPSFSNWDITTRGVGMVRSSFVVRVRETVFLKTYF